MIPVKSIARNVFSVFVLPGVLFVSVPAFGQQPIILERYVCPSVTESQFIYSAIKAPESDRVCDSGTQMRVITSGDIDIASSITVKREGGGQDGPHRAIVDISWNAGMTGVVTIEVQYRRREHDVWDCYWQSWKYMYTYKVYRQNVNPGGSIAGQTTFTSATDDSERLFSFSYTPADNFTNGVKIRYRNGRVNNGVPEVTETPLTRNAQGRHNPVAINYYATGFNTTQAPAYTSPIEVLNDCGSWLAGPTLNFSFKPTCYLDVPGNVSIVVNNPWAAHPDGYELEANKDYSLTVTGITDLLSHYDWNVQDGGSDITFAQNNFRVLKDLGSYSIYLVPKPRRDFCPGIEHVTVKVFVSGSDLVLEDPNGCSITLPDDFATKFPEYNIDPDDVIFTHFRATVISKKSIVIKPGFTLAMGSELILDTPPQPPTPIDPDHLKNFTEHLVYNEYRQIIVHNRTYYDDAGRIEQQQSKNFTREVMMAQGYVNDAYGRTVITTLPAPVDASTITNTTDVCGDNQQTGENIKFKFRENFITAASDGAAYRTKHFDISNNVIIEGSPQPVGNSEEATLGWYYSSNNGSASRPKMNEEFVANTSFPYTRTIYHRDGSGKVKGVSKPGDAFRPGSGRMAITDYEAVTADDPYLANYVTMRKAALNFDAPASLENEFVKSITYDEASNKSEVYTDKSGAALITLYFGTSNTPITKSYAFYDLAGRLRFSIPPEGVKEFEKGNVAFNLIEKTTYSYNHKGWLISLTEPDAGTTRYFYRKDGKIRFSQNAEQADTKNNTEPERYSFTNYDDAGRPVESGEYIPAAGGIRFGSQQMKDILEDVTPSGGLSEDLGVRKDQTLTFYDLPDNSLSRNQRFMHNAVASTQNSNVKTWYSYDEQGRIEWMIQDIKDFAIKTLDYRYGPTGAVQEVLYQKGGSDQFTHFYEYNADGLLHKVYTTAKLLEYNKQGEVVNRNDLTLQATYYYYLHGALKRIEYANDVQGIDYVYTVDGMLKSINDADPNKDPGRDGSNNFKPDVFGMTLDYYAGDYLNSKHSPSSATYPGTDQFTGLIKGNRWHSPIGNHVQEGYRYTYDSRNQLKESNWINTIVGVASPYAETMGSFTDGEGYDLNGNILSLNRKNNLGQNIAQFKYDYANHTNKLSRILNASNNTALKTYTYNRIGQLTEQKDLLENKTLKMEYDVSGKVVAVRNTSNVLTTTYGYDDRGFRVSKSSHDAQGNVTKTTWYVRDSNGNTIGTYEQNMSNLSVSLIEVPVYASGRIGLYKPAYYQTLYELNDHLGNVRAVIAGQIIVTSLATMESERYEKESQDFIKIRRSVTSRDINHTPELVTVDGETEEVQPNEVIRLNNRPRGSYRPNPIGAASVLWVHPGDTVRAEVFAKYMRFKSRKHGAITNLALYLAKSFSGAAAVIDSKVFVQSFDNSAISALGAWNKLDDDQPRAFLNGIVFDNKMMPQRFDFTQVSEKAKINPTNPKSPHEKIELEFVIEKEGYLYLYVSNESTENMDVYFDDFKITHSVGEIVAGGDYYPYGLEIEDRQITLENYRFGYQGQFAEKDKETGWNHFELREYDPVIGRWTSIDPKAQYHSPYVGMGNNPSNGVDPDGAWLFGLFGSTSEQRQAARAIRDQYEGAEINNFFSSKISVTYQTGDVEINPEFAGTDGAPLFIPMVMSRTISFQKSGRIDYGNTISNAVADMELDMQNAWLRIAAGPSPGNVDFDPLTQLSLGFAIIAAPATVSQGLGRVGVAFGPLNQWVRVGPSYSHYLGQSTRLSIRWGASTVNNLKYVRQIGSPTLRWYNQALRVQRIPIKNWRFMDAGHIHLIK